MNISANYPELSGFLSACFENADFENHSDKDIVCRHARRIQPEELGQVWEEANRLVREAKVLPEELERLTGFTFEDREAALEWVRGIQEFLEAGEV